MSRDFSELSYKLTKEFSKDIKKNGGIYFTPPNTVISSLDIIQAYSKYTLEWCGNILEPSCGSCEYVIELTKRFPKASIKAIEYNKVIYDSIVNMKTDMLNIINADFLKYKANADNIKFDLIIGNPPYYVMKKGEVDKKYYEYFEGRPNIFIIFIIKSLELLNVGGILSFVLPLNFLNCLYYDKARAYISKHFKIISITYCNDKYIETQQDTLLFIIEKIDIAQEIIDNNDNNNEYVIKIKDYTIFGIKENIKILKSLYENSYSLADIGFKVNVGSVVWNQCKNILTDDKGETRLIYSGDIKNNKLIYKKYADKKKKNHILKRGIKEPLLIINRGYGVGNYNFEYCLISSDYYDDCEEYLIENHLICIRYHTLINKDDLIYKYEKIINSLNDNRTREFIKIYFGNNAINTTELNYILPIYNEEYS
jgi:adenine-specific DNA-methyltransferase